MEMAIRGIWLCVLLFLMWEDWQTRSVSGWALLLFFALSIAFFFSIYGALWMVVAHTAIFNIAFLLIQFLLLQLYFYWKTREWQTIIDRKIGLGDMLFIIILACLIHFSSFTWIYVGALLFSLVFALLLSQNARDKGVPLITSIGSFLLLGILVHGLMRYLNLPFPQLNFFELWWI
ncbi:MAG: hypothetical protein AAF705_19595 [Bacteroidota bacterium]